MTRPAAPSSSRLGCLVLAAGGSTRLGGGQAKQLLRYGGRSLVRRAAETALELNPALVVVALGCRADECGAELAGLPIGTAWAEHWASGMGASLKTGLRAALAREPDLDALLVTLCDQPLVTAADLRGLVAAWKGTGDARPAPAIVAAAYAGSGGVPALFTRETFPDLAGLDDAAGAKRVIARHAAVPGRVARVPLPHAATDVDTAEDYARLAGAPSR